MLFFTPLSKPESQKNVVHFPYQTLRFLFWNIDSPDVTFFYEYDLIEDANQV